MPTKKIKLFRTLAKIIPDFGVLSELYDNMGDNVSIQYAGSAAHKKYQLEIPMRFRTMKTTKEFITSFHRHYNNSFQDQEKQNAINMLLGVFNVQKHPKPWATNQLDVDSWLHHTPLRDQFNPGGEDFLQLCGRTYQIQSL